MSNFAKMQQSGKDCIIFLDNRQKLINEAPCKICSNDFYGVNANFFCFDEIALHEAQLPLNPGMAKIFNDKISQVLWHNCDYPFYILLNYFPNYDYYWCIEYDVYYNGKDYSSFFAQYEDCDVDLIAPHIGERALDWIWYKGIDWVYPETHNRRGLFFPVVCLSNSAVYKLYQKRKLDGRKFEKFLKIKSKYGWQIEWTHCELFVATEIIINLGLKYRELANLGAFGCTHLDFSDNQFRNYDNKMYHPIKNVDKKFLNA
jgi:hypothetical protein